jgi:hypothetical protein
VKSLAGALLAQLGRRRCIGLDLVGQLVQRATGLDLLAEHVGDQLGVRGSYLVGVIERFVGELLSQQAPGGAGGVDAGTPHGQLASQPVDVSVSGFQRAAPGL